MSVQAKIISDQILALTINDLQTTYILPDKNFKRGLKVLSADRKAGPIVCGCNKNRIILIKGSEVNILRASQVPSTLYQPSKVQIDEDVKYSRQDITNVSISPDGSYFVSQSGIKGSSHVVRRIWDFYTGECIFRYQLFKINGVVYVRKKMWKDESPRYDINHAITDFDAYAESVWDAMSSGALPRSGAGKSRLLRF